MPDRCMKQKAGLVWVIVMTFIYGSYWQIICRSERAEGGKIPNIFFSAPTLAAVPVYLCSLKQCFRVLQIRLHTLRLALELSTSILLPLPIV
ncbi:uncharacterized protein P884DRAFT_257511 [Thermothelomyces heterothallicus CBS 202.75]|uniref:uncharacterized protein n=1 Tax=Thermothelomyces heterothallicus CBS 202.75 TaxID=1149848 RepID=UPI0037431264